MPHLLSLATQPQILLSGSSFDMALRIATRANQALTLPALLIATFVNESTSEPVIIVGYEDAESLSSTDKAAAVEYVDKGTSPATGCNEVVKALIEKFPGALKAKDITAVRS